MRLLIAMAGAGLLLASCGDATVQQRPETEGSAARTEMDAATKVYAECVSSQAETMPVADEAAGTLALNAMAVCKGSRDVLVEKVAAFNAIGYPERTPQQLDTVAEASVKLLDDEARQAAVVTIVRRQTETTDTSGTGPTPPPATKG
ncbi:hypothetical protein [Polymorphobacter sp.]|uniref:hypothetical protein n=1 Tax=Polymorphobacter sp. TaxID=1909290 RepID=UPI003F7136CA